MSPHIFYPGDVYFSPGCTNGGDVVFAVDSSGSIGKDNFKELLSVVIDITEKLEIDKANTNDRGFRYFKLYPFYQQRNFQLCVHFKNNHFYCK